MTTRCTLPFAEALAAELTRRMLLPTVSASLTRTRLSLAQFEHMKREHLLAVTDTLGLGLSERMYFVRCVRDARKAVQEAPDFVEPRREPSYSYSLMSYNDDDEEADGEEEEDEAHPRLGGIEDEDEFVFVCVGGKAKEDEHPAAAAQVTEDNHANMLQQAQAYELSLSRPTPEPCANILPPCFQAPSPPTCPAPPLPTAVTSPRPTKPCPAPPVDKQAKKSPVMAASPTPAQEAKAEEDTRAAAAKASAKAVLRAFDSKYRQTLAVLVAHLHTGVDDEIRKHLWTRVDPQQEGEVPLAALHDVLFNVYKLCLLEHNTQEQREALAEQLRWELKADIKPVADWIIAHQLRGRHALRRHDLARLADWVTELVRLG